MITDYLAELIGSLDVPAARRRRIIAEVEDHLQSTAAELHASGLTSMPPNVRRFGDSARRRRSSRPSTRTKRPVPAARRGARRCSSPRCSS